MKKKRVVIMFFEIFLIVMFTVAISHSIKSIDYPVNSGNGGNSFLGSLIIVYKFLVEHLIGDKNFASAVSQSDLQTPQVYTCLKGKKGICQETPVFSEKDREKCNSECDSACIPSPASQISACQIGTCYDKTEGTCEVGSPKGVCENNSGEWFNDPNGNIPQCKRGCCVLGSQTNFVTEQQCSRQSGLLGLKEDFKSNVDTELGCYALAKTQVQGACVIPSVNPGEKNGCKFTTAATCSGIDGEFHAGFLCSNPKLNTSCEKEATAQCVVGKDEIYWFDSCGNQENIYSANKVASWNNGMVLPKNQSCSLGTPGNPLANQGTCGNCNFLQGSKCGVKTNTQQLADKSINFVCKDLGCVDSSGQERENGESWCSYQGAIGNDTGAGGFQRSVDTPGSTDFRQICIDGEVQTESCGPYRNNICIQSDTPKAGGGTFSSASCVLNSWQQCLGYNTQVKQDDPNSKTEMETKCSQNPFCIVKDVDVSKNFKFNLCAPKYPEGFDLSGNGKSAESICSLGSQKCTAVFVKKLFSGWKCEANCDCLKQGFTQQMNDLCMSLGDCGASVNYNGQLSTSGYSVNNAPELSDSYLDTLKSYADYRNSPNKYAEIKNLSAYFGGIGVPGTLGQPGEIKDPSASIIKMGLVTSGLTGGLLLTLAYAAPTAFGGFGAGVATVANSLGASFGTTATVTTGGFSAAGPGSNAAIIAANGNPGLIGLGGALAGAAAGLAAVSLLLKFTGVGKGLPAELVYTLMAGGAVAGGIIGYTIVTGGNLLAGASLFGVVGLVVIVVLIIVFKLLGIGKTKKVTATFSCKPWQPPFGGNSCGQCGKDGLPCNNYECQSLGQTCKLINQGTTNVECVNIAPNDVTSPMINPGESNKNYTYAGNENGVKITTNSGEGCIQAYQQVSLNVETNEPAQCKFDTNHTDSYKDMQFDFGSSLFLENHTMPFSVPDLASLGLPGYDPNRKYDENLYLRCVDKSGNANVKEYDLSFCIKPGKDVTPPVVVHQDPDQEYIAFNATKQPFTISTNEPSDCKWDLKDTNYNLMKNNMTCDNDIQDRGLYGWDCNSTIPIEGNETTAYIRCEDQPWLNDSSKRNVDTQSYKLTYKKSLTPLNITNLSPNNMTLTFGVVPASVEIKLNTEGGVDGTARCSYSYNGQDFIDFKNTLGTEHSQVFQSLFSGDYSMPIRCVDSVGNVATATAKFNVKLDTTPPAVVLAYNNGGTLTISTDENSKCGFEIGGNENPYSCSFDVNDGNVTMMSGSELTHTSPFEGKGTYYIKCEDKFGNSPDYCSAIIKNGI